jgi:hypothetical protein
MRDVSVVGFGPEQTKTVLAVTKTHAHMTSCPDGHLVSKGVCLTYEVRVRAIVVRGCSACDIGQRATDTWRIEPGRDQKGSWMRQLLQNIDQKHVVSLEKIIYKKFKIILRIRTWATYNNMKYQVKRSSKIVELAQAERRSREVGKGGNALP